ncbi:hypothetical protein [Stappia sp. WLB 29]|uniref:hypothetical protein n=1 Tax=Stappia sp. WLB 29 TaxID=2925220 RepID=UPI0020C01896|nr:hypothetical protein [Stappia sp. WLB 29]
MKAVTVAAAIAVLSTLPTAGAQDMDTATHLSWQELKVAMVKSPTADNTIVFATATPVGHGVRKDGDNPLGEVTPIQGTSDISFRQCGAEHAEIIPASSILPTNEVCASVPGISHPSLQARHWVYSPDLEGFKVADPDDAQQPGATAFVKCHDLPSALLVVAGKTQNGEEAIAGPSEALASLDVHADKQAAVPEETLSTLSQCRVAPEFWTFDASTKQLASDAMIQILGVSRNRPRVM